MPDLAFGIVKRTLWITGLIVVVAGLVATAVLPDGSPRWFREYGSVLASAVLVVVTLGYVVFTKQLADTAVNAAKDAARAATQAREQAVRTALTPIVHENWGTAGRLILGSADR